MLHPEVQEAELREKLTQFEAILRKGAPMLVAYSGGVDSTYLLAAAHLVIPGEVAGIIADSPSLPRTALQEAVAIAGQLGAPVEVVPTEELENPDYANNPPNRCYFCKAELFTKMEQLAAARDAKTLAYGENADDASQVRPGRTAAEEFRVCAPLKEAGLTKAEIRRLSRLLELPTAEAPAQPCLSSRIPHGTAVTRDALSLVERGEEFVRSLGYRVFRVRYVPPHGAGPGARLEIAPEEMDPSKEALLRSGLMAAGFASVEIDVRGYRPPAAHGAGAR